MINSIKKLLSSIFLALTIGTLTFAMEEQNNAEEKKSDEIILHDNGTLLALPNELLSSLFEHTLPNHQMPVEQIIEKFEDSLAFISSCKTLTQFRSTLVQHIKKNLKQYISKRIKITSGCNNLLNLAINEKSYRVASILIEAGFAHYLVVSSKALAHLFFWSISIGNSELAKKLFDELNRREDFKLVELKEKRLGRTALHLAAENNSLACVNLLLEADASINAKTNNELIPLMLAIIKGDVEMIRCLILADSNVNFKNSWGLTPIICAQLAHANSEERDKIISLLKEFGAEENSTDYNDLKKRTALFFTIDYDLIFGAEKLLEEDNIKFGIKKASEEVEATSNEFNAQNNPQIISPRTRLRSIDILHIKNTHITKETPLTYAFKKPNKAMINLFIKSKANISLGKSALISAIINDVDIEFIKLLIDSGAKLDYQNMYGQIALHTAVSIPHPNLKIIKFLLSLSSNPNAEDGTGTTPLLAALFNPNAKRYKIVKLLLKNKANVNFARAEDYITPLLVAIDQSDPKLVALLLKYNADIYHCSSKGTAWEVANIKGNREIINLIKAKLNRYKKK